MCLGKLKKEIFVEIPSLVNSYNSNHYWVPTSAFVVVSALLDSGHSDLLNPINISLLQSTPACSSLLQCQGDTSDTVTGNSHQTLRD